MDGILVRTSQCWSGVGGISGMLGGSNNTTTTTTTTSNGGNYPSGIDSPSAGSPSKMKPASQASPAIVRGGRRSSSYQQKRPGTDRMAKVSNASVSDGQHRMRNGGRVRSEPMCVLNCCCFNGSFVVLWMGSDAVPSTSTESSPFHRRQSAAYIDRTGSVSTCSVDEQQLSIVYGGVGTTPAIINGPYEQSDPPITCLEGAPNTAERLGRIQFNVNYNFQSMTLDLKILCATDLAAKDLSGTSDPYVKILLLPDKKHKLTTNIKRKNLNPKWNESFAFEGFPYSKLMSRTLYLQVIDYDRFSRDDPIGEVCLPLCDLDLVRGQTLWKNLQPCKGHTGKLGEVFLSLCYQPTAESLTINVIEARELKSKDINGLSDPYIKIWLLLDGKKVEKRKTSVAEKTLNPVFNEMFMFRFPYERVRQTSLVVSVMDHDRMGRNELIGQVVLGSKSGPAEVKHWKEMFAQPRQSVAHWHLLRNFR